MPDKNKKRDPLPTMEQYKAILQSLSNNPRALVTLKLLAETGMTRIEVVHIEKRNLDIEKRELYIPRAKAVRHKVNKKFVYIERNRYVPINSSLMPLLTLYINSHDSPYILIQDHHFKDMHHLTPESINALFKVWDIKRWSPHKFRHFFKQQVKDYMIRERQMDDEVLRQMMGHNQDVHQTYGDNSWEYLLRIVDGTFG